MKYVALYFQRSSWMFRSSAECSTFLDITEVYKKYRVSGGRSFEKGWLLWFIQYLSSNEETEVLKKILKTYFLCTTHLCLHHDVPDPERFL